MLTILEVLLVIGGVLAAYAGDHLSNPALFNAGILTLGAGFALGGMEAIVTRRIGFWSRSIGSTSYRGLAAVFQGAVFLMVGASVMAYALARFLNVEEAAFSLLRNRPGIIFLGLAVVLLGLGSANVLGAMEARGSLWTVLLSLPYRLGGLVLVVLGLIAMVIGLFELFDPDGFDDFVASIIEALPALPQ